MIKTKFLHLEASAQMDLIDITDQLHEFVEEHSVQEGVVSVFVQGSTGAVTVIEYEPNLIKDFKMAMERIAPSDIIYEHAKTWHDDNGHAHIRASVVGCSEIIPVQNAKLLLGTWQQVIVVDFDTRPRNRKVCLTLSY